MHNFLYELSASNLPHTKATISEKMYVVVETHKFGEKLTVSHPFTGHKAAASFLAKKFDQKRKMLETALCEGEYKGNHISKYETISEEKTDEFYSLSLGGINDFFCGHVKEIFVPVRLENNIVLHPKQIYLLIEVSEFGDIVSVFGPFPSLLSVGIFTQNQYWSHDYELFGSRDPDGHSEFSDMYSNGYQLHCDNCGNSALIYGHICRISFR